ncbi:MAG: hypothetical protein U0R26_08705 [Solirubrobacterales bacterium]
MTVKTKGNEIGFTAWLCEQQDRDDPVGDLARDAAVDPNWPGDVALSDLIDHVGGFAEDTLKEAYTEYENQK